MYMYEYKCLCIKLHLIEEYNTKLYVYALTL